MVATDHLESPAFRGLTHDDLFDIMARHGLHFDQSRQVGVVFHMMSALSELGRIGLTAVGETQERRMQPTAAPRRSSPTRPPKHSSTRSSRRCESPEYHIAEHHTHKPAVGGHSGEHYPGVSMDAGTSRARLASRACAA